MSVIIFIVGMFLLVDGYVAERAATTGIHEITAAVRVGSGVISIGLAAAIFYLGSINRQVKLLGGRAAAAGTPTEHSAPGSSPPPAADGTDTAREASANVVKSRAR